MNRQGTPSAPGGTAKKFDCKYWFRNSNRKITFDPHTNLE